MGRRGIEPLCIVWWHTWNLESSVRDQRDNEKDMKAGVRAADPIADPSLRDRPGGQSSAELLVHLAQGGRS